MISFIPNLRSYGQLFVLVLITVLKRAANMNKYDWCIPIMVVEGSSKRLALTLVSEPRFSQENTNLH